MQDLRPLIVHIRLYLQSTASTHYPIHTSVVRSSALISVNLSIIAHKITTIYQLPYQSSSHQHIIITKSSLSTTSSHKPSFRLQELLYIFYLISVFISRSFGLSHHLLWFTIILGVNL